MKKLLEKIKARHKKTASTLRRYGVEVKRCNDCERGDCETCPYKEQLTALLMSPCCNGCADSKTCPFRPEWGKPIRLNCILWREGEHNDKGDAESVQGPAPRA